MCDVFFPQECNYIYFGSYPQAKLIDELLIKKLSKFAGNTLTLIIDDNIEYATDVEYNGSKYRGVHLNKNTYWFKYVLFAVIVLITICLCSCNKVQYAEDEIVGLTSVEIAEKYGDFDRTQGVPDEDGLYRDCACGYLISEKRVDFFGTTPPEYFMIYFDEDGFAHWCQYEKVV